MNLSEVIRSLSTLNDNDTLFIEDINDINSTLIVYDASEISNGSLKVNGIYYSYLLEVFLAKEFVENWLENLDYIPSNEEIAIRLYEYAINDA